jgi:hypothetical protein
MNKGKLVYAFVVLAGLGLCLNASALWSPAWQVAMTDALDTGGTVYTDVYSLGVGGNGVDAYSLVDDVLKVHLIGWPDSSYTGPVPVAVSISSTVDGAELAKDARADAAEISWDIDLTASGSLTGTETISWALTSVPGDKGLSLIDYGSDASRTSVVATTDMKSAGLYAFASTKSVASTRYMQVVLGATVVEAPVLSVSASGADAVLSWTGSASASYTVYYSSDMGGAWTAAQVIGGVDGAMQWTDVGAVGAAGKRFYKLEVN